MRPLFDKFRRRINLEIPLRCQTALRIGGGKSMDSLTSDLPVLRDALGRPLIPGASFKGVVRSQVEALLRSLSPGDPTIAACDPLGAGACLRDRDKGRRELKDRRPAAQQADAAVERARRVCWACSIFGAPGLASHVVFSDAVPDGAVLVERRDGVAIDRDLGRAADNLKFDYEVVPAGTRYLLRLTLHDLEPHLEGAVIQGLELLGEGFARLGGFKSRGLGEVKILHEQVVIKELALSTDKKKLDTSTRRWDEFRADRMAQFQAWCAQGMPEEVSRA